MGQYRPDFDVDARYSNGKAKYANIDRRPYRRELATARAAAEAAGLWRFDSRW